MIDGGSIEIQWLLLRQSYDDDELVDACAPTRLMIYIFDFFSLDTGGHCIRNSISALEVKLWKSILRMCQIADQFSPFEIARSLSSLLVLVLRTLYISVVWQVCSQAPNRPSMLTRNTEDRSAS